MSKKYLPLFVMAPSFSIHIIVCSHLGRYSNVSPCLPHHPDIHYTYINCCPGYYKWHRDCGLRKSQISSCHVINFDYHFCSGVIFLGGITSITPSPTPSPRVTSSIRSKKASGVVIRTYCPRITSDAIFYLFMKKLNHASNYYKCRFIGIQTLGGEVVICLLEWLNTYLNDYKNK